MSARPIVHDLVRDLYRDAELRRTFGATPAVVLDRYALTDTEREQLLDGSFPALHALGMHPLAQIVYLLAKDPALAEQITAREYFEPGTGGSDAWAR